MAPQLDQRSQRKPQAVFCCCCVFFSSFFIFFLALSGSSCFCLGMPQFWHERSEVTRPQEPSRSVSPMHCHYDSPFTRVPVARLRHSRHSSVNMHSLACSQMHTFIAVGRLLTLPRLLRNRSTWDCRWSFFFIFLQAQWPIGLLKT